MMLNQALSMTECTDYQHLGNVDCLFHYLQELSDDQL
jgi:hypothetical protein